MTTLLIILWIITVITEFISLLLEFLRNYLVDSVQKDVEELKEEYYWLLHPKATIDEKVAQGKEYVGEKYEQGKEYVSAVAEQGKVKLDEAKTAVQNFFTKSKKAE